MLQSELESREAITLLREINARLARQTPMQFDDLMPHEQQMLYEALVEKTPLSEIVEINETNADMVAVRREQTQREERARVMRAKMAGAEAAQIDSYAKVAAEVFDANRGEFGA